MTLDRNDPELERMRSRLAPYARTLLDRAGEHAARLHADMVTLEHLLAVVLEDEDSAAHQLVLHAFADPATIAGETLAISPGVMVVAADSTLPFSTRGVVALRRARELAVEARADEVGASELLLGAREELEDAAREMLDAAGFRAAAAERSAQAGAGGEPGGSKIDADGPLFRHFSMTAKRSLSAANRGAAQAGQRAISPAQVLIGCLRTDEALGEETGVTWQRARMLLASHSEDPTPVPQRELPADAGLRGFLGGLGDGADSLTLLGAMRTRGPTELAEILVRHKISEELLERALGAFRDPIQPPERSADEDRGTSPVPEARTVLPGPGKADPNVSTIRPVGAIDGVRARLAPPAPPS